MKLEDAEREFAEDMRVERAHLIWQSIYPSGSPYCEVEILQFHTIGPFEEFPDGMSWKFDE